MPPITHFGDGTQTDFPVPSGRVVDRLLVTGSPVTFTQPNANTAADLTIVLDAAGIFTAPR